MTSEPAFVQIARDPSLIEGIYDACDQWCMYCPVTQRCLAYRCSPDFRSGKQDIYRSLADRLYEGVMFLKRLCQAEGRPTPEIDAMLSDDPRRKAQLIEIDDPIERMARRYGRLSDAYLLSRADFPFEMRPRASGPTPFEVFAWFHQLVPAKVYRALLSAAHAARGDANRKDDALISAKVALIGMDRSLDALAAMAAEDVAGERSETSHASAPRQGSGRPEPWSKGGGGAPRALKDDDPRLELLQAQLRRLRREVEGRFPAARSFVRMGLDRAPDPVPPNPTDGSDRPDSLGA